MIAQFNPADWYWIVAGYGTKVWSSSRAAYVPSTDENYKAWLSSGFLPSQINSAGELFEVLMQHWAPLEQSAGVHVTSAATPALNGTYAIDDSAIANITSLSTGIAAGKPLPGGGATFNYREITGVPHAFDGPSFLNFAAAVEGYVYAFQDTLLSMVSGASVSLPSSSLTIP